MYNGERSLLSLHNKYVLFHESFLADQIQFWNHQKQKWAYQAVKTIVRVVLKVLAGLRWCCRVGEANVGVGLILYRSGLVLRRVTKWVYHV